MVKAADANWSKAEFTLFQLYYNGSPPGKECTPYPKDHVQAIKWLRQAAAHSFLQAEAYLAIILIRGQEVEQDKVEAEKLLRDAAGHGLVQAQNDLGFSIEHGDVNSKDLTEALMWLKIAKAHATDPAVARRIDVNISNLLSRITSDQEVEADRRSADFKAEPDAELDPMTPGWENNQAYRQEDGRFGH